MSFDLQVPTRDNDHPFDISISDGSSIVIVGANGSGKTRLAVHLENALGEQVHRISAHRALGLNPAVPKIKESIALNGLRFGLPREDGSVRHRKNQRWEDGNEATALLNDFDYLLQALFADQSRVALATHTAARANNLRDVEATRLERLKVIWEQLLPTRELELSGDDIQVKVPGGAEPYSAAEMSDGERAIFYLIGQILEAREHSLLVIDEPELHVHRSIMNKLWDQLENARSDCSFVFITHDLEFASSRVGKKYVISDYTPNGPQWRIEKVPEGTGFSEELTTLLIGSRRPILFVEGGDGSLDKATYRCAYPEWTVIPLGSCKDVVHAVTTMHANASLTRIECAGVVDRDDYDSTEVESLEQLGIAVLPVSEIENLFLLPEVSRAIALAEHFDEAEAEVCVAQLKDEILAMSSSSDVIEPVVRRYVLRRIDRELKEMDLSTLRTVADIDASYRQRSRELDIQALAQQQRIKINESIANADMYTLLALIDNKGMLAKAASCLKNTHRKAFEAWLVRSLLNDKEPELRNALIGALPALPETGAHRSRPPRGVTANFISC